MRNKIKKQLLNDTENLKDKKGFIQAGYPRYLALFGRDSLIIAWQLLGYDISIAHNTLLILAKFQGKRLDAITEEEPGKILHEYYPRNTSSKWWKKYKVKYSWLKRGKAFYTSTDSTPLFLILLAKYFQKTKDKKLLLKLWPNAKKATKWILNYSDINKDGFIDYQQKNPKGPPNQSWKDHRGYRIKPPVAMVEIQGYAFLAFKETAKLARVLKDKNTEKRLLKEAKIIKKNFNQKFWMKKEKYFALALDGDKKQVKEITSDPGHLLFTGILDKNKEKFVVRKLFSPELWTPFGIRTYSTKSKFFRPLSYHLGSIWPHDNWIIAQGLKKLGYKKEYKRIKDAIVDAHNQLGYIPELYGFINGHVVKIPNACYPQAWSSGALYNFLFLN